MARKKPAAPVAGRGAVESRAEYQAVLHTPASPPADDSGPEPSGGGAPSEDAPSAEAPPRKRRRTVAPSEVEEGKDTEVEKIPVWTHLDADIHWPIAQLPLTPAPPRTTSTGLNASMSSQRAGTLDISLKIGSDAPHTGSCLLEDTKSSSIGEVRPGIGTPRGTSYPSNRY